MRPDVADIVHGPAVDEVAVARAVSDVLLALGPGRLQVQERLTEQVAAWLQPCSLSPSTEPLSPTPMHEETTS